jgi:hypothetical protein
MKAKIIFAWYDFWIGFFYDQKKKRLYFFPIPCFGIWFEIIPKHIRKGITGYDILEMEDCPYTLPSAKSMKQAVIDYRHLEPQLFEWYNNRKTS